MATILIPEPPPGGWNGELVPKPVEPDRITCAGCGAVSVEEYVDNHCWSTRDGFRSAKHCREHKAYYSCKNCKNVVCPDCGSSYQWY